MRQGGIYQNAIIILHGDHGSRITKFQPSKKFFGRPSTRDLVDLFSTLFAVKLPEGQWNYDRTTLPIEELLMETIFPHLEMTGNSLNNKSEPFVYLGKEGGFKKIPYALEENGK